MPLTCTFQQRKAVIIEADNSHEGEVYIYWKGILSLNNKYTMLQLIKFLLRVGC